MKDPAIATIQHLSALLVDPDELGYAAHCIGIETGLRFAMQKPEYARLLLTQLDKEMEVNGVDEGRVAAEDAIEVVVLEKPVAREETPDVR